VDHGIASDRELSPGDIGRLVQALLDSIDRGQIDATEEDVRFLRSVDDLLHPAR
jgi:hypothetical protein